MEVWPSGQGRMEQYNHTYASAIHMSTIIGKIIAKGPHNTWPKGKPLYENWRAMPANYAVQAVNKRRQISNMAGLGMEAIEGLCFLASLPLASTGWTKGGEKTQPFNRFHSRLFIGFTL